MSLPNELLPVGLLGTGAAGAYEIERSLRFNSSDSAYSSRTFASDPSTRTKCHWHWAVKRSTLGTDQRMFGGYTGTSGDSTFLIFTSSDTFRFNVGGGQGNLITNAVFRDPSAWYLFDLAFDSTLATAGDRAKLWVNGVLQTWASGSVAQNAVHEFALANSNNRIGSNWDTSLFFSGYLADIHFIDGQALDPTSFGEFDTNGVWQPIEYTGTYGTNGFHLPFSDNSTAAALGTDTSGNGNDWSVFNISTSTGGPTSVASASGALPIYNTTDTYGTVKGTGTRTDSNSSSIVLAVPMEGANNGTTFIDESAIIKGSGSPVSLSRTGAITSTSTSKFYGSSGYLNGSSYLSFTSSSIAVNQDFCIEFWWNLASYTSPPYNNPRAINYGGFEVLRDNTNTVRVYFPSGSSLTSSVTQALDTWTHWAVTRSSGTIRLFKDGVQVGAVSNTTGTSGTAGLIGGKLTSADLMNGYLSDVRVYIGTAKYTSNFNPPSATQVPTVAAGIDSLVDSPTNGSQTDTGVGGEVVGNYCTLNPLACNSTSQLSNGNLVFSGLGSTWKYANATLGVKSGKWYWEAVCTGNSQIGIVANPSLSTESKAAGTITFRTTAYWVDGSSTSTSVFTAGDTIGFALDLDSATRTLKQYANGTLKNTINIPVNTTWNDAYIFPGTSTYDASYIDTFNFGQRPFAYTAPSGYKALCTANLPDPVVAQPSTVMGVALWTGNSSTQTISGLEFSPDLAWIKIRSFTGQHQIADAIRGSTEILFSNSTAAEVTKSTGITSFTSDGFTLGSDTGFNRSPDTYVAWTWDAGSSTVTNTDGSITSQVRANPSAGFSIVTYTGTGVAGTIGHGLNVAPLVVLTKRRDSADNWYYFTTVIDGSYDYLFLNTTAAKANSVSAVPTSSVINVSTSASLNANGGTYVSYCFAPIEGYSAFGSYTGNGSADGIFTYLGFLPKLIIIKRTNTTSNWTIFDTSREGYNVDNDPLYPNLLDAEGTKDLLDIVSNGFKLRTTDASVNASGGTYIYAAWASNPFKYSRSR